jgi:hypothetical protein
MAKNGLLIAKLGDIQSRVLHSELELEISSRFSSRNEFSRVETRRVERHFFRENEKREKTRFSRFFRDFSRIFCEFSRKLGSERVFASRDEFGKSSKNSLQP